MWLVGAVVCLLAAKRGSNCSLTRAIDGRIARCGIFSSRCHSRDCNVNKKFELMLTGRAKAYSSSCPQAVTHRSTNRARSRVTSFQPKRVTNDATPPMSAPWRRLVNDFVSQSEIAQKIHKKSLFWRSRSSKVIEWRQSKASIRFPISD